MRHLFDSRQMLYKGLGVTICLTLSYSFNAFRIANQSYFEQFQKDSEALVVGGMAARKIDRSFPNEWQAGFTTFRNFERTNQFLMQAYYILSSPEKVEEYPIQAKDITSVEWVGQSPAPSNKVLLKKNTILEKYVGRALQLGSISRTLETIEHVGDQTILFLSPPVVSFEDLQQFPMKLLSDPPDYSSIVLNPYMSQFGLQSYIFSLASKYFGLTPEFGNGILSLLCGLIVAIIFLYYEKIFPKGFGICFLIGLFLSPSMTGFARNLYWVAFSWFLPAMLACQLFLLTRDRTKCFLLVGIFMSFLFRFLCGYEYASSIVCFSVAPFVYGALTSKSLSGFWRGMRGAFVICLLSLSAFGVALCMHGSKRGHTIWEGLAHIYEFDVKRRTYGNPDRFDHGTQESLKTTPQKVVELYIFDIDARFLASIPWKYFKFVLLLAILSFPLRGRMYTLTIRSDAALFLSFFVVPISWFVLGKGHSWVHTHMNMVLWYWGFVGVMLFLSWRALKIICKRLWYWAKKMQVEGVSS